MDRRYSRAWDKRRADYQRKCVREIFEIIETNPIKFEEVNIGDGLTLYAPLKGLSKVRFDDQEESIPIRNRFGRVYGLFENTEPSGLMWGLASVDDFVVYDKETEHLSVRVDEPSKRFVDPFTHWISINFFQKK